MLFKTGLCRVNDLCRLISIHRDSRYGSSGCVTLCYTLLHSAKVIVLSMCYDNSPLDCLVSLSSGSTGNSEVDYIFIQRTLSCIDPDLIVPAYHLLCPD